MISVKKYHPILQNKGRLDNNSDSTDGTEGQMLKKHDVNHKHGNRSNALYVLLAALLLMMCNGCNTLKCNFLLSDLLEVIIESVFGACLQVIFWFPNLS